MEPIFLTGFMGAGKTTVGKELGKRLAMTVYDSDEMIESVVNKKVKQIFQDEGEAAFRCYESEMIRKLSCDNVIVTTGGGAVIKKQNRQWMNENGIIFYLHCEPDVIIQRLWQDTERPLLQEKSVEDITDLYQSRLPYYLQADHVVTTTGQDVDMIVEEIVDHLISRNRNRA